MNRFFIVTLVLLTSCKDMETEHPRLENISESVYASGLVKTRNQYEVYSTVNGVISNVLATDGMLVKKGDVLMTVRNESSQLNVENAKLAAAQADLMANTNKLTEARAAVDMALAEFKDDSLLLVRQRNLRTQNIGTQVALEQRELAFKNSSTNYQVALLKYKDLQRDLKFLSTQSKTNLKISKSLYNDYFIRSEINGKVYKVFKDRGELTNALSPVAIVGDAEDFYIELNVDEYDIARVKVGQSIVVMMDSYKGKVFEAYVEKIGPLMNEQSRSFIVTAGFISRPPLLYPNLSVEANIIIRSRQKALTIPRHYLIGDSLVMVGKHETRKVVVGIMDYRKAEIVSGLTESDIIYKTIQ